MVGLVLVSHSVKITDGLKDLAAEIAPDHKGIISAGGMEDGSIGTDAIRISEAIRQSNDGDGVVVLADLGSGVMSAETAIELLDGEGIDVRFADAPIVEGTIAAAVSAMVGSDVDAVVKAAEDTRGAHKKI
jgi:dihydroxyacetone kinase phosphotransfer subunit